jgi:CRISPR-associated protein Csm2
MNQSGRSDKVVNGRSGAEEEFTRNISEVGSFKDYAGDLLVRDAENIAGSIKGELKNAQLRRIYGEVKKMEMDFKKHEGPFPKDRVVMLKPRLAYAASKKYEVILIKNIFTKCIDKIHDRDDFIKFVSFFEAILAYHR